jgi:H2-forming N5,N10-methylenetetrahydromethanopterin dehydrogenase-like enzyme
VTIEVGEAPLGGARFTVRFAPAREAGVAAGRR